MHDDELIRRLDDKFYATLDEIDLWLKSRGITQRNRLRVYRDNLRLLRTLEKSQNPAQTYANLADEGRITEILSSFTESMEFADSLSALRMAEIQIPDDLLKKALSGPVDAFQENEKSNQGRNAMFELSMGAMIAREGLAPIFSTANPDIAFNVDGRPIKMECKRVISESKLYERIDEGIAQLSKSVLEAEDIGIVAVSITRLFNRGDIVLLGSDEPHETLSRELKVMLQGMEQKLAAMAKPSVTAILFYLSSPFYVPQKGYTSTSSGTIFPMDQKAVPFLRHLCNLLRLR